MTSIIFYEFIRQSISLWIAIIFLFKFIHSTIVLMLFLASLFFKTKLFLPFFTFSEYRIKYTHNLTFLK